MTRLDRFSGGLAATTALAAAGVLSGSPTLLVAATVPVAFVVYGALTRVRPDPGEVSVERSIERVSPLPGERVGVRLSVTNEGGFVPDLRIVDGVPGEMAVVEGSPRGGFALGRGETATLEYVVTARRGRYEFGPVGVRPRSTSGSGVVTWALAAAGDGTLACRPEVESVPVRRRIRQFAGTVGTDTGGSGVEFHSTREYRRGDPVNRVDWRRLARTGDLTTVNYREHRAARLVLLVDSRRRCHVAPAPDAPTGAAICAHGAGRIMDALLSAGHEVGTAALGLVDGTGGPALVAPGHGEEHRLHARELLDAAAETPESVPPDRRPIRGDPPGGTGPGGSRRAPGNIPGDGLDGDGPPDDDGPDDGATGPGRAPGAVADGGRGSGDGTPGDGTPDDGSDGDDSPSEDARPDDGSEGSRGPSQRSRGPGQRSRGPSQRSRGPGEGSHGPSGNSRDGSHGDDGGEGSGEGSWEADPGDAVDEEDLRTLSGRLPPNAGVFLFTPALDGYPETVARTLSAFGHPVTVVSPDVTGGEGTGSRLLAVERELHLESLRAAGATVVDWDRSEPLAVALAGTVEGP